MFKLWAVLHFLPAPSPARCCYVLTSVYLVLTFQSRLTWCVGEGGCLAGLVSHCTWKTRAQLASREDLGYRVLLDPWKYLCVLACRFVLKVLISMCLPLQFF